MVSRTFLVVRRKLQVRIKVRDLWPIHACNVYHKATMETFKATMRHNVMNAKEGFENGNWCLPFFHIADCTQLPANSLWWSFVRVAIHSKYAIFADSHKLSLHYSNSIIRYTLLDYLFGMPLHSCFHLFPSQLIFGDDSGILTLPYLFSDIIKMHQMTLRVIFFFKLLATSTCKHTHSFNALPQICLDAILNL